MPHPTVALARAAAEGEEFERVSAAVRRAVALAGGLEDVVRPGDTVLIKPNLVAQPPTHPCGACTRPSVCRAVADLVAERGATPIIAESSARGIDTEAVMQFTGYGALRDLGYQVVDLKRTPTVVAPIPGGVALQQVVTYEPVLQADVIISAPVIKTHDQTDTSLSLKNLKGLITDAEKRRCHQLGVFEAVADLATLFKPAFAVADGITAQEGLGPVYGLPVEWNLIAAGHDLLALDAVVSAAMGFDPQEIRLLRAAAARGLGKLDLDAIRVVGAPLADVRRRFMRMEEDERLALEGVAILHAEGSCTGCRNGVLSSLFDMIQAGTIARARGVTLVTGEVDPASLAGIWDDLVPVGVCCSPELRVHPRYVKGCPPNNVDIVAAIEERARGVSGRFRAS